MLQSQQKQLHKTMCSLVFCYHLTKQIKQTKVLGLKEDWYSVYED